MTTQEAIKQLQTEHDLIAGERDLDGSQFAPALLEALAMAIEALKVQDTTLYMNLPEVSAEEVVEILKRNNRIELLPSAQPEIIRCKDCGHWDTTWQNDFAPNYHYCSLVDGTRRGDFFCADAERRGEQDGKNT